MKEFYATVEVRLIVEAANEADARARIVVFIAEPDCCPSVSVKGMDVVAITEE